MKNCKDCNQVLLRHEGESRSTFEARKYCSWACRRRYLFHHSNPHLEPHWRSKCREYIPSRDGVML